MNQKDDPFSVTSPVVSSERVAMSRIVLIVGAGRCGLVSLVHLLNRQANTRATLEEPPLLPWQRAPGDRVVRERFQRFRRSRDAQIIADAAAFYLPYSEDALAAEPELRVVGLKRPREEVIASFSRFLDEWNIYPTNHWAEEPAIGWMHEPLWTQTFPQYEITNREEGMRRYWDEYYQRLEELASRFPDKVRVFDMSETLNAESGQRAILDFAGYPRDEQVLQPGVRVRRVRPPATRPGLTRRSTSPLDPAKCVVLVPFTGYIFPPCEQGLRELERRGYQVRRVGGFAAIDQGRNVLATEALIDGFEETMWIDSDVEFHPDAVNQLRAHGLPISCGVYAQKRRRAVAIHVLPGTPKLVFGPGGGLIEILYAATGFLHVRREVYLKVQHRLRLPVANQRFGAPMIPFFHPMLHPIEDGTWYLAEDYAFSQRVREGGFKIVADTSIRLWHIGTYPFGWEDAGFEPERSASFTLHLPANLPPKEK
jgi:hypothetical protein